MTRNAATVIGFTAVLMWSLLAWFSASTGATPPFQLTAITFAIGAIVGLSSWPFRPNVAAGLRQPWLVWLLGFVGLFLYHAIYFFAVRSAPVAEVSLIAYLWPLFIVLFSTFLPNERLKLHHVIGVIFGLAGAVLVITRGNISHGFTNFSIGHVLAFSCALIWSTYTVLSRRHQNVPTDIVVGYCSLTAVFSLLCHLSFETTVWPTDLLQWLAIIALGVFPLGLGFYAWDFGVKHGDIMVLGAASYAAPLLSTLVLLLAGQTAFHWSIAVACALVTAGALIAAKDMFAKN